MPRRSTTTNLWLPADAMIGLLTLGARHAGQLVAHLAEEGRDQRHRAIAAALDLFHRLDFVVSTSGPDQDQPDQDQEVGPVAGVTTDPAIAEWVQRVFHRAPLAKNDSGEPPP